MKEPQNKMQSLNDFVLHELRELRKFQAAYAAYNRQHGNSLFPMRMEQPEWNEQYCLWRDLDQTTNQDLEDGQNKGSSNSDTEGTSSTGD